MTEAVARQKANEERPPVAGDHLNGLEFDPISAGCSNVENSAYVVAQNKADDSKGDDQEILGFGGDIKVNDIQIDSATNGGDGSNNSLHAAAVSTHPALVRHAGQANFAIASSARVQAAISSIPMPFHGAVHGQVFNTRSLPYNPYAVQRVNKFPRGVGINESNLDSSYAQPRMFTRDVLSCS